MTDLILDSNSLLARCWFAVKEDPEKTATLFVQSVLQLLDQNGSRIGAPISRTLFGWDGQPKTTKNHSEKPLAYKETRRRVQEAILTLFGTDNAYHPDHEADDIVATAVYNSKAEQVYVVSGDKDLMQLQGGNVAYYCLNNKAILAARQIASKFGVKRPSQVAIALAIIGDHGDGISGIPRWGPKKVEKLFEAVTEEMNFNTALEAISGQIPAELMPIFIDSLDKTLLHNDVPDVPEPPPLVFCSVKELNRLKIDKITESYERIAMQYEGGEEALNEMLKGSKSESRPQIPD